MATIKDIAKKLNLGVSTVSMALNDSPRIKASTKEKVLETAKELGYIRNGLAADLQQGRSNLILLVVEDASRPFFSAVIDEVQKRVAYHNFDLLISTTFKGHAKTAEKYISEHRAAGAIVFTMNIDNDFINRYASKDFPIFLIGRPIEGQYTKSMPYDDVIDFTGYKATQYLIDKGYKDIAFVFGALDTLGSIRKLEGYLRALSDNNIEINEDLLFYADDSQFESGYVATQQLIPLIKEKKLDSIVYGNDDIAIGGLNCLKDAGLNVPNDVAIIGCTNLPMSTMIKPALTTIGGSDRSLSYQYAVDYLVCQILGQDINEIEEKYKLRIDKYEEVVFERETVKL